MVKKKIMSLGCAIIISLGLFGCNSSEAKEETMKKEEIVVDELIGTEVKLSSNETAILTELINSSKEVIMDYKYNTEDLVGLLRGVVLENDTMTFDKIKSSMGCEITVEYAQKILEEGVNLKVSKEELTSHRDYNDGKIEFIFADGGGRPYTYIKKVVKGEGDKLFIHVNSTFESDYAGAELKEDYIIEGKRNKDSMFGFTLTGATKEAGQKAKFNKVTSSSFLTEGVNIKHTPENLMDGSLSTAWVEGVKGFGQGEYVLFEGENEIEISGAFVGNGYLKSDSIRSKNARAKKLRFDFSDGTTFEYELTPFKYNVHEGLNCTDVIHFGRVVKTKSVKMTIVEVYEGSKYEDTCISEVEFIK